MADAVSKLYAEIGFVVKKDELNNAKKKIEEFAEKLSSISSDANKLLGNSSKKEVKEHEENQKQIINIDKYVYRQRINNLKIYSRQASSIWRDLTKIAQLPFKGAKKIYRTGRAVYDFMKPSMDEAYNFENFSFESGMNLADFQNYRKMFALSGIKMSSQDIMEDMLSVQRNLTDVALKQGGVLDAYKLTNVREAAERNDLKGVIDGIMRGVRDLTIDESMLRKLMEMFQFGHSVEWARLARSNPRENRMFVETFISEKERQKILDAYEKINLAGVAFSNLRNNIVAKASPFLSRFSDALLQAESVIISKIRAGEFDSFFKRLSNLGEKFANWAESLNEEDLNQFMSAMRDASKAFIFIAKGLGSLFSALSKHVYEITGGAVGAKGGAAIGGMVAGPIGATVGGVVGAGVGYVGGKAIKNYNALPKEEKEQWEDLSKGKDYFDIEAAMGGVVKRSSSQPTRPSIVTITTNNNIETTLNGLSDNEKKEEFEKIVKEATDVNQKRDQISAARGYNLLWVQGNTA